MRRALVVLTILSTTVAAACVPPTSSVPPPALPAGVGVQWVRDAGGTVDPQDGEYTAALDRYVLLDGTVTGPAPAGAFPDPPPPNLPILYSRDVWTPDGTARFPFNGFAGEGIFMTFAPTGYDLTFPGGTCRLATEYVEGVFPSPDGTKVGVYERNIDGGSTSVSVRRLVDGGNCPVLASEFHASATGRGVGGPTVWSPDSSAIAYRYTEQDAMGTSLPSLHRLDAVAGAAPVTIATLEPGTFVTPLGWSTADRILYSSFRLYTSPPRLQLATVLVAGGSSRVLDQLDLTGLSTGGSFGYVGYFVPGTTTVVYTDAEIVTNPTGQRYPWMRLRKIADAAGATSGPLVTPKPPLTWHQEAINTGDGPPFTLVDVPNNELLERFTH